MLAVLLALPQRSLGGESVRGGPSFQANTPPAVDFLQERQEWKHDVVVCSLIEIILAISPPLLLVVVCQGLQSKRAANRKPIAHRAPSHRTGLAGLQLHENGQCLDDEVD